MVPETPPPYLREELGNEVISAWVSDQLITTQLIRVQIGVHLLSGRGALSGKVWMLSFRVGGVAHVWYERDRAVGEQTAQTCAKALTAVMPTSHFLGCEVPNFDQAINRRPSSGSNCSS